MKTLSERFRLVVFGAIAIVAVVSCCNVLVPDTFPSLEIGHDLRGKTTHKRTYVKWKSPDKFNEALDQVCSHGGSYKIYVLMQDSDPDSTDPYRPCNRSVNIRTVKVTKSKVANGAAAGDPHVTMKVASAFPGDIIKVLGALATPTPAP